MRRQRSATAMVEIDGEQVPLRVNWHASARRFILRLDAASGGARLTLPVHADLDDAIRFLKRHERWLLRERLALGSAEADADDGTLPLRGEAHAIAALGTGARRIWVERPDEAGASPRLCIGGPADTANGRMVRWLKGEARADLEAAVKVHAARLDVSPGTIAVRDQRSRWGSCSTTGTLSFSWRLILTPRSVLDYVAAHEVAHLREMNHSPRFWTLVEQSFGDTSAPRKWLRTHGTGLHRYGR